jgi:CheY-like chemotaxis protein
MTGYEACEIIKADSELAHIPVVFLSAKGQEAEVRTGMEAGAVEYILKPFAPDQHAARIQSIQDAFE